MDEVIVTVKGSPLTINDLNNEGIDLAYKLASLIDKIHLLHEDRVKAQNILNNCDDELDRANLLASFLAEEVDRQKIHYQATLRSIDSEVKVN